MRDKRERKRLRLNPTHRWSDTQTKILLAAILDELQANGVNAFEKPTAMRFYDKITRNVEEINGFATWTVCRSKMRHLKQNYLQALEWNRKTGAGLLSEGNTRAVTEYMAKCCPFWDLLDKIFGQNGQSLKQEEESGEGKDDPLLVVLREEDYANEHYENEEEEEDDDEYEEREENGIDNSETDQTFSENDFNAFKNQFKQKTTKPAAPARQPTTGKTCNKSTSSTTTFSANSGSIAVLVSMQEKKLQFEEMKWRQQQEHELQKIELEREKCKLMKMELKQRQELKRLEIERDERLAMAKMQLETESEERIKKYELELKIKNNLY